MPPFHPDGARHAHLRLPLGGKHHEDHDDQEHAGADREEAEDHEERGHEVPYLLCRADSVIFGVTEAKAQVIVLNHAAKVVLDRVRERNTVTNTAAVGDRDEADALVPKQLLQGVEAGDDALLVLVVRHPSQNAVLDDIEDLEFVLLVVHPELHGVAGPGPQLIGRFFVHVGLVWAERSDVQNVAVLGRDYIGEAVESAGIEPR